MKKLLERIKLRRGSSPANTQLHDELSTRLGFVADESFQRNKKRYVPGKTKAEKGLVFTDEEYRRFVDNVFSRQLP